MKYNFEDNNIVVGHIKELLHSFNLPMIPVYTKDTVLYKNRAYIKDNKIVKWTGSEFKVLADYIYNTQIVNVTKRLEMTSAIYDNYTHEYLGDYLRFVRDYHHVDLMSLYNCFGKKRPSRIYYTQKLSNTFTLNIDTDNSNYNYYIVPVKFNKNYTIAMDSDIKWEIVTLLYSNIFVENVPESLIKESYRTISGSKFSKPFLYSTYFSCADTCWDKEKNLVLLLKIPSFVNSSIVILEGDYTSYSDIIDGTQITDIKYDDEAKNEKIEYVNKCSLIEANLENSYPFSDRLVEYLLENAITPADKFQKNITRTQDAVYNGVVKGYYGIWDNQLKNSIHNLLLKPDITKGPNPKYGNVIQKFDTYRMNIWEDVQNPKRFIDIYNDALDYVDKDVETLLRLL